MNWLGSLQDNDGPVDIDLDCYWSEGPMGIPLVILLIEHITNQPTR